MGPFIIFVALLCSSFSPASPLQSLYRSLDPLSISEHLAFYSLYPETEEGKLALRHTWELLFDGPLPDDRCYLSLPELDIQGVLSLVNKDRMKPPAPLAEEQLTLIETIASRLHNRKLKGSSVWTPEQVLQLPLNEIDLARGLLIEQLADQHNPSWQQQIRQYEASLDLMALQIQARLPSNPTHVDKVHAINHFVFQEMRFRFPPHSVHAKDVDLYTFLPSVLDSRQGVCLGVSILYLSLAQRLDLPLEIITPPGHIYVRYHDASQIINIETTARGIDLPSERYLGVNTRSLQQHTIKEVIGMAFFNEASLAWSQGEHRKTVRLYEKALSYMPNDPLLKMFLGLNYLFVGKTREGHSLLKQIRNQPFEDSVSPETLPDDYLKGRVDIAGIQAVFRPVDETKESLHKKQEELSLILRRYPFFRAGLFMLASTWLQLDRLSEAQEILLRYHKIDSQNPTVEYYLALISAQRLDYPAAWVFLKNAEAITAARGHHPQALTQLRTSLTTKCPEPK